MNHVINNLGPHGLPLIGRADWNDCLNLNCFSETPGEAFQTTENKEGGVAESVFIAALFTLAVGEMREIAATLTAADLPAGYATTGTFYDYFSDRDDVIASLVETCKLNAVDPQFVMPIFEAALEAGVEGLPLAFDRGSGVRRRCNHREARQRLVAAGRRPSTVPVRRPADGRSVGSVICGSLRSDVCGTSGDGAYLRCRVGARAKVTR